MKKKNYKPIHKFNDGRGATLCNKCNKIISIGLIDELFCEEHGGKRVYRYKLVRKGDGLVKNGNVVFWVEWDENSRGKDKHEKIGIGYSLLLDPVYGNWTWLTTTVTEILEDQGTYIRFKTKNSEYELYDSTATNRETTTN